MDLKKLVSEVESILKSKENKKVEGVFIGPIVDLNRKLGDIYFDYFDKIEALWKQIKTSNFANNKDKDTLLRLCEECRIIFWQYMKVNMKVLSLNKIDIESVPCYQRAIMLFEVEKKWDIALRLTENAVKMGLDGDWYRKRIVKLTKKIND